MSAPWLWTSERARRFRRSRPIVGAVGANGSGKTACLVYDSMPSLASGRYVLSTVRLLDFENPRLCDDPSCTSPNHESHMAAHPFYIPWRSWGDLLDADHCDVLADEITGVASSRDGSSLPPAVANTLVQLRRRDIVLRWSAPSYSRCEKILRECTQAVVLATGYARRAVEDGDRLWESRNLFRWTMYDATVLEQFEAGKRDKARALSFSLNWGPALGVFQAYDTFDTVERVGKVSASGTCEDCGGTRARPKCICGEHGPSGLQLVNQPRRSVGV